MILKALNHETAAPCGRAEPKSMTPGLLTLSAPIMVISNPNLDVIRHDNFGCQAVETLEVYKALKT